MSRRIVSMAFAFFVACVARCSSDEGSHAIDTAVAEVSSAEDYTEDYTEDYAEYDHRMIEHSSGQSG